MSETPNLQLPYVAPSQAQKHVTVNEALSRVDATMHLSVESRTLATPPLVVTAGESYLVPPGGIDDWTGHGGKIAAFINGGWQYLSPRVGWQIWVEDEAKRLTFDGAQWFDNLLAMSVSRAALRAEVVELDVTLAGGSSFEETPFIIPTHTSVLAVTGRVLSTITGDLTSWSLGVEDAETRYGDNISLTQGIWVRGVTGQPVAYYDPTRLRLTAEGGNFAGGEIRLAVHLFEFDIPSED